LIVVLQLSPFVSQVPKTSGNVEDRGSTLDWHFDGAPVFRIEALEDVTLVRVELQVLRRRQETSPAVAVLHGVPECR
jgi:hypothetical protein